MPEVTKRVKLLTTLLAAIPYSLIGDIGDICDLEVTAIETDSRKVVPGTLFVAISGGSTDGHAYIRQAQQNGCVAVVGEKGRGAGSDVPFVEVEDCRIVLAELACTFYDNPAQDLILVGITGTNGKTTTTYLLESILQRAGARPGVIGTVNYRFNGQEYPAPFTTPEPVILQKMLREMVHGGVTHLVMEVSSHAIVQRRIHGLQFDVLLFTNLSRDHLDFHGTMRNYFDAKKMLFEMYIKENGKAVICCGKNGSDLGNGHDWGQILLEELQAESFKQKDKASLAKEVFEIISCGLEEKCDLFVTDVLPSLSGVEAMVTFRQEKVHLKSGLVGLFNLKNIMGAVGVGFALGLSGEKIKKGIGEIRNVPGRLEKVAFTYPHNGENGAPQCSCCSLFVDYAHTPDALENVLQTIRQLAHGRIVVVFGCGGDRDRGKRFSMGEVAGRLADVIIITTDNSRSESPEGIMATIEEGVRSAGVEKLGGQGSGALGYEIIGDRATAIRYALLVAHKDDIVLLAGKGHETYQITGQQKVYFDDRVEAKKQMELLQRAA